MMRCANCGAFLRPEDRFCSSCGEPADDFEEDIADGLAEENDAGLTNARHQNDRAMQDSIFEDEPEDVYDEGRLFGNRSAAQTNGRYSGRQRKAADTLYDEHVFRDSFLDKTEEGHHAFLVTLTVLLVIATLSVGGLFLYTYLRQRGSIGSAGSQSEQHSGSTTSDNEGALSSGVAADAVSAEGTVSSDTVTAGTSDGEIVILTDGAAVQSGADNAGQGEGTQAENPAVQEGSPASASSDMQSTDTAGSGAGQSDAASQNASSAQSESQTEQTAQIDIAQIEKIMDDESTADRYGIAVYDLNTDKEYLIGASGEQMYASATITIPILYTAALQLDQGAITLNDQITYVNSIGGRGEPYPSQRDGYAYPLSYYLTTMLTYSDNNCINCLIDFFGLQNINNTCQGAGYTSVDLQRKIVADVTDGSENYVSARDLTRMVKELYNGRFTTIGRDFMKQNFRITPDDEYNTLIGQSEALPDTVTLLNQNGRGDTRYAETALILDDSHAYIISVMSTGEYGYLYEDAFRHVSDYVYNSL